MYMHTDRCSCLIKDSNFNYSDTGNTESGARERLQGDLDSKNALCRKNLGSASDQLNFSQRLLWDQSQAATRQEGASSDGGKISRAVGSCDS